ncbi:MAG: DUF2849 domain-containing protein [Pseudomonadota bacterium]
MPKPSKPLIVTGNHLFEGDVIYLTAVGGWSREHAEAVVATDAKAAAALLEEAKAQPEIVVGPYLAETDLGPDGRPAPNHYRERIRTLGPTIPVGPENALLGKQAEA